MRAFFTLVGKTETKKQLRWLAKIKLLTVFFMFFGSSYLVHASVDLEIQSIQIVLPRLTKHFEVELTAILRNNGSEPASNIFLEVDIYQNKHKIKALSGIPVLANLPRLGSASGLTVSLGVFPVGDYQATVVVDPDNVIKETNEGNNEKKIDFSIHKPIG